MPGTAHVVVQPRLVWHGPNPQGPSVGLGEALGVGEAVGVGVAAGVAVGDEGGVAASVAVADGDGLGFGDEVPCDAEHAASRRHAAPAQAVTKRVEISICVIRK